jgi:hypothetical protein
MTIILPGVSTTPSSTFNTPCTHNTGAIIAAQQVLHLSACYLHCAVRPYHSRKFTLSLHSLCCSSCHTVNTCCMQVNSFNLGFNTAVASIGPSNDDITAISYSIYCSVALLTARSSLSSFSNSVLKLVLILLPCDVNCSTICACCLLSAASSLLCSTLCVQ